MYKLNHFAARHRHLMKVLTTILWFGFWTVLSVYLHVNYIICGICAIVCAGVYLIWVEAAPQHIMLKASEKYTKECDPYPLLSETEKILSYDLSEANRQLALMNKSMALSGAGRNGEAYDILASLNIDKLAGTPYVTKIVYYNNIMDFTTRLSRFDEAERAYEKMMQLYGDMKDSKQKKALEGTVACAHYMAMYRRGEYMKAIELINAIEPTSPSMKVDNALFYAKCCIALGDVERARETLNFVCENGNRLCFVDEAREILKAI